MNSKRRSPFSDDLRPRSLWVAFIMLFAVIGTTGSLAQSASAQGFSAGLTSELVFGPVFPSLIASRVDLRFASGPIFG